MTGWVLKELTGRLPWVVLDRAGWNVPPRVEIPEGIRLVFLPPYLPELQPVERVWPLVSHGRSPYPGEAVANRYFRDMVQHSHIRPEGV